MKIRKWFIESKKVFGIIVLEAYGPELPDGARVDVIDATGMPTKEEIKQALGIIVHNAGNADFSGFVSYKKLREWLERLAEE